MRILIVAATSIEVAPVLASLRELSERGPRLTRYAHSAHDIDVLITGVGMVATAAWCSRVLALARYDVALNFGVCGSFDRALKPGDVVQVVTDRIAELGAEDGEAFLSIHELNLPGEHEFTNAAPPANAALRRLPSVSGNHREHGARQRAFDCGSRSSASSRRWKAWRARRSCRRVSFTMSRSRRCARCPMSSSGAIVMPGRLAEAIGVLGTTALGILEDA